MYDVMESVKLAESSGKTAVTSDQGKRKGIFKKVSAALVSDSVLPVFPLQTAHFVKKVPEATANFAQSRISRIFCQLHLRAAEHATCPWLTCE